MTIYCGLLEGVGEVIMFYDSIKALILVVSFMKLLVVESYVVVYTEICEKVAGSAGKAALYEKYILNPIFY